MVAMVHGLFITISVFILKGILGAANVTFQDQVRLRSPKIINGEGAPRGKYPSQALIYREGVFLCGGTILDQYHILTAAHCIVGSQAASGGINMTEYLEMKEFTNVRYTIAIGKHMVGEDFGSDQYRKVEKVFLHEEYDSGTNAHDIAVIRLQEPIQFNEYVQSVVLADYGSTINKRCYASGFGLVRQNPETLASTLQEIRSRVVSRTRCIRIAGKYGVAKLINDLVLCTKDRKAGVCSGDSGGPISCFVNGSYTQIGILSFGSTSCLRGFNIYTRVSKYRNWIHSKVIGE